MDRLIQIIRTFDGYKMPHIDVLGNKDSTSQHTKLYRAIIEGKVNTDDEAAQFIFGKTAHRGTPTYRNFKTEFKKQLLHTLLFIDTAHKDFDVYQKNIYEINREWMTIRAISRHGMSNISLPLAEKLLDLIIKYDYTDLAIQVLDILKYATAMQGDKKQYAIYQALSDDSVRQWLMEQKAKDYHNILKMEYMESSEYKPFLSDAAKGYFEELKPEMEKYDTTILHMYGRIVEIYIYSTVNDYENVLAVAERALAFFRAKSFEVKAAISMFQHQKMIALMTLKRYTEAEKVAEETIALRVKGSFNWFVAQESKMFLLFKMHRFTEGYALYANITKMSQFKEIRKGMSKEMWFLFNAYFHVLHHLGKMPLSAFGEKNKVFKLPKFLNNVPTLCKDKDGMNLVVLSIKICFLVATKQYETLTKEVETLEKYFDRHTKQGDPYYRYHQFGSLLLKISQSNFNRALTQQNTVELRKNLESVAFDPVTSAYRGELINLEEVWDWLLDTLD